MVCAKAAFFMVPNRVTPVMQRPASVPASDSSVNNSDRCQEFPGCCEFMGYIALNTKEVAVIALIQIKPKHQLLIREVVHIGKSTDAIKQACIHLF